MDAESSSAHLPSTKQIILLVISASLALWYMHFREIDIPRRAERQQLHGEIVARTAPSPYRYRVLVPYSAQALSKVLTIPLGPDRAFIFAYGLLEMLFMLLLSLALCRYLQRFFSPLAALVGVLLGQISMVVALRDHYFQPWSLANAAFFALAALFLSHSRLGAFALVVLVSAFNRETSALIPFMYPAVMAGKRRWGRLALESFLLFVLWAGAYLAVRDFQGAGPSLYGISDVLSKNLAPRNLLFFAANMVLFLGVGWVYLLGGFRAAPAFVRRLALIVPLYLVPIGLLGVWKEVRLLMPLYPVLLPFILSHLFPARRL